MVSSESLKKSTFGRTTYPAKLQAEVVTMVELHERWFRGRLIYKSIVTEDGELLRLLGCAQPVVEELYASNQRTVCVQTYSDHNQVRHVADAIPVN